MQDKSKLKMAIFSTFPPRHCGIGTFAKSLHSNLSSLYVNEPLGVIAVSDEKGLYDYPPEVIWEVDKYNEKAYVRAAEFINNSDIEVVSLQHEYGIYGGPDGHYILRFLENVNRPVVTNFHSVLREHSEHRAKLTQRILDLSDSVIVMTKDAKRILQETFAVEPTKIKTISHGVPNVRLDQKDAAKKNLGLTGKKVLSTFGLINRGKGIESVILALAQLKGHHPDLIYLTIGVTHPDILRSEGESYRQFLAGLVRKNKLSSQVKFVNRFLDYNELLEYLMATDIYLAPQLDLAQSFSGTVSYAMGCGAAVISSPTRYASEVLAGGRGVIVDGTSEGLARELDHLLSSESLLRKTQLKAYQFARERIWPQVSLETLRVIESNLFVANEKWQQRLPDFNEKPSLSYLRRMTTRIGLVQHCQETRPNMEFGYSLDDQARALLAVLQQSEIFGSKAFLTVLMKTYLNYLKKAVDRNGVIHNFFDRSGHYADSIASADSIARSFWALTYAQNSPALPPSLKEEVRRLAVTYQSRLRGGYLRTIAYSLLGYYYNHDTTAVTRLANNLIERFEHNSEGKWRWFEDELTWANAIVPFATLKAYKLVPSEAYFKTALAATEFLEQVCRHHSVPAPIGQDGWFVKGGRRALFDQQPIEAGDMVMLLNELYNLTGEKRWRERALEWMGWFYGNNLNEVILYDDLTKGVCDGITRRGMNRNQGAESTLVYLLAYLSFSLAKGR